MQELEGNLAVLEAQQASMKEAAGSQHAEVCLLLTASTYSILQERLMR